MKKQRPNLIKNIGSKTKKVIGIKTWGGIGDGILITPALKALKQKYPDSEIRVTCNKNHEDILVNNPYIDFLSVSPDDSAIKNVELDFLFDTNYGQLKPSLNFDKHASEIIGDMVGVNVKSKQLDIFLSEKAETKAKVLLSKYKNPIVMHISSKCSKNQEWDLDNWEKLVDGIPEYDFIQIGLKNTDPYVKGAVDMRGTSIMEAIAIVKHSKAFVGVDSFVAHAANAVGTRGVVLFGPSNPEVWGHTNNINIYKGLKCAPCIDIIGGNPCQIGKKCMTKIGVKEVRESLLSIVDKNFIKSKSLLEKVLVYR